MSLFILHHFCTLHFPVTVTTTRLICCDHGYTHPPLHNQFIAVLSNFFSLLYPFATYFTLLSSIKQNISDNITVSMPDKLFKTKCFKFSLDSVKCKISCSLIIFATWEGSDNCCYSRLFFYFLCFDETPITERKTLQRQVDLKSVCCSKALLPWFRVLILDNSKV